MTELQEEQEEQMVKIYSENKKIQVESVWTGGYYHINKRGEHKWQDIKEEL